jgi:septum formation protein
MKSLILASRSPARRELLERTGFSFTVEASNYEEDMTLKLPPKELAIYLSKGKAKDVASHHQAAVVLAADSFAVLDDKLLGKPHTVERAKEILAMLSGRSHSFVTGFTIIDTDSGKEFSGSAETIVYFRDLTPGDINSYVAKEDVLNKAAAYIIQGLGAILVERVEGDYSNVMGLPLPAVARALKDFDINLL